MSASSSSYQSFPMFIKLRRGEALWVVRKGIRRPRDQPMCHLEFQNDFWPLAGIESFPKSGHLSKLENILLSLSQKNISLHTLPGGV